MRHLKHLAGSFASVVGAALLIGFLAGCSGDADPSTGSELPDKDIDSWTLPLDPFLLSEEQMKKADYASAIKTTECAAKQGVGRPVPYIDFDGVYGNDAAVRTWFDKKIAQKRGYHTASELPRPGLKAWDEYAPTGDTQESQKAYENCSKKLGEENGLPRYSNRVMNFTSDLAAAAYSGASSDPDVTAAVTGWKKCMAPKGIADLPDNPLNMPSPSLIKKFNLQPGKDAARTAPTAPEIDMATFDAECRESSGYHQKFYEALWAREASLRKDNASALAEIKDQIDKTDQKISDVIAKYDFSGD